MKNRRLCRALMSILLTVILAVIEPANVLCASEITEPGNTEGQNLILMEGAGVVQDDEVDEIALTEGKALNNQNEDLQNEEVSGGLKSSEDTLYADGEAVLRPTDAQENVAAELGEELDKLDGLIPGVDYVEDEAILLADTRGEAEKIAKQYGADLICYSEGVATIRFPEGVTAEGSFGEVTDSIKTLREAEKTFKNAGEEFDSSERYMGLIKDLEDIDEDLAQNISGIDVDKLPDTPVYLNLIYHICVNPDDDPLYGTSNSQPKGQWFHKSINSTDAWAKGADGSGVRVAVIDSGVDTSNNDLNGVDAKYSQASGTIPSGEDQNGHGTHCVGIIGARDNNIGGLGVAPNADIISIRAGGVTGSLRNDDIARAIQIAANDRADIISMSFGSSVQSDVISQKLKAAMNEGILCIAAAGNEGVNKMFYPAATSGVISVGSYASDDSLSSFSNYGSWVDLAAPGSFIMATMPDDDVYMIQQGCFSDVYRNGCSYGKISGTSMACPVVAGVAALVMSYCKKNGYSYNADQIKDALLKSAPDRTYKFQSHTVNGGIDALKAVEYVDSLKGSTGDEPGKGNVEKKGDFLYINLGDEAKIMQGKSVALSASSSFKSKISYSSTDDTGMISVTKAGVIKVNKKAEIGSTAVITASCEGFKDSTKVIVIPANSEVYRFRLSAEPLTLSTDEDAANHQVQVYMSGGSDDPARTVKLELSGKGSARFAIGKSETKAWSYEVSNGPLCKIIAQRAGKVTLTASATDGSNYKQSITFDVVSPMESVDITFAGVPIRGDHIQMAKGASLQLKAVARGAADDTVSGKVRYIWSGPYISKSGKVSAPKEGADFNVTVTAEDSNGNTASKTLRIWAGKSSKIVYMGYAMKSSKGAKYYNSVNSGGTIDGDPYTVGECYGYSNMNMPDLSSIGLTGPIGFATKSAKDFTGWDYSNNNGQYVIDIKGPSVTFPIYGDYGMRGFTPGKKGSYKFVFTALDGSGKTFTVPFKVTQDQVSSSISVEEVISSPGEMKLKK